MLGYVPSTTASCCSHVCVCFAQLSVYGVLMSLIQTSTLATLGVLEVIDPTFLYFLLFFVLLLLSVMSYPTFLYSSNVSYHW